MIELLPEKAAFTPDEDVVVEARGLTDGAAVHAYRLDRVVAESVVDGGRARFGSLPVGGYGVECEGATTAFDVLARPLERMRYGFVSHYEPGRSAEGVAENLRRLHLNAVQFYDWMYRHANLLPPADEYEDALGQKLSLGTVRALVDAIASVGSQPLAYAAVYAAGKEEWPSWEDAGLFHADGSPWTLGDFLWNLDPTNERWLTHFAADLRRALELGFTGFHLDQYGAPKWALRADDSRVDLADAFPLLIRRIAGELPDAQLVFNNVNDFPTWATAGAQQAATYIEVWPPHTRLRDLAALVAKARTLAPQRPVVLAVYLAPFTGDEQAALAGEKLVLATICSSGGSGLLHGEERAVLTEAYYVRHRTLSDNGLDAVRRYLDFVVRYGDVLYDPTAVDVTCSHFGGENLEVVVEAPVPVSADADAGALWCRVVRMRGCLAVHLIDLSSQDDDEWATPKLASAPLGGVRVSVLRRARIAAQILACSPDEGPALTALSVTSTDRYDTVEVPPFTVWSLLQVREASE